MAPPLDSLPISHSHSSTPTGNTLDPAVWEDAPPFLLQVPDKFERIAIRNANHNAYRLLGTTNMWHKYIRLGYYIFDDCMEFQRAWKSIAKEAVSNRHKIVWKSLHIHRMNDIPPNDSLTHSAMNIAKPFLDANDPDFILATDMEFEEKKFFEMTTNDSDTTLPDEDTGWTEVSPKKSKRKTPTNSPELTAIAPHPTNLEPGFSIDDMDISDEALLGIDLARATPLPSNKHQLGTPADSTDSQPTTQDDEHTDKFNTPIINPYNRQSKLRNSKNLQTTQTSKSLNNPENGRLDISTNPTPTTIALLDDKINQPNDKSNNHTNFPATNSNSTRSNFTHRDNTPINDGTLRITIRWKPENYDDISNDDHIWTIQATKMIKDIFAHPTDAISVVPWQDKSIISTRIIRTGSLTPEIVTTLRSPKVSNIDSLRMSIFALRICATDSTWISNDSVKAALKQHHAVLNISNSTCDSGQMVTAGTILLKHPTFTHRLYFLRAIRRCLPPNTPFFDIGVHQRSANGIQSPHLVVRCGENHHETLTEILSDFFDGIQTTALYIGTKVIASMTQEATEELFDMHQKYVNSIQRLPLSPHIVNIDRIREEISGLQGEESVARSTRAWANSIKSEEGKSLQCDAENGGKDKKAYLLVPTQLLDQVQPILLKYMQRIRSANSATRNSTGSTMDRPDEIYVPTASVQRNVEFLRTLSSASIWKNAPSTIRTHVKTTPTQTSTQHPSEKIPHRTANITQPSQLHTPLRQGKVGSATAHNIDHTTNTRTTTPAHREPPPHHARHPDNTTIATFTSTASTTLNSSYQATRFAELESAIKANQLAFKNMNTNYTTMENRVMETMEACHENSKQLVTMHTQMATMQTTMQAIADQISVLTDHIMDHSNKSPVKKKQRQTGEKPQHNKLEGTNLIFALDNDKLDNSTSSPNSTIADQEEAQYTAPSSPDSAMEE